MIKKRFFKKGIAMVLSAGLFLSIPQFVLASPAITNEAEQTESAIHKVANDIKIGNLREYGNGFAIANTNSALSIPKNPQQPIKLKTVAGTLSVKMPHTNTLKSAEEVDGTVVYGSKKDAVDLAVQGIDCNNGSAVRSLIVINDNSAPRKYTFEFDLSKGEKIVPGKDYSDSPEAKDGYLYVVDDKEKVTDPETNKTFSESLFCIEPAWAKDKNGKNVNTQYEIHGNKVTQVIEFDENTAFPVVADPAMSGYYYKKKNVSYSEGFEKNFHRVSATVGPEKKDSQITVGKDYTFHGSVNGYDYGKSLFPEVTFEDNEAIVKYMDIEI